MNEIYLSLFFLILFAWTLKYAVELFMIFRKKQKITKLQAQVAMLRMNLKRNIRKKSNQIDNIVGIDAGLVKNIKDIYSRIFELNLNDSKNYQVVLNGLKEITDIISDTQFGMAEKIQHLKQELTPESKLSDLENNFSNPHFWKKLYENEGPIVAGIYDVVQLTHELRQHIEIFNKKVKKSDKYESIPEEIQIEQFALLKNIIDEESFFKPEGTEAATTVAA
jgi:hypothetical protein